jgi:hypothetical protein
MCQCQMMNVYEIILNLVRYYHFYTNILFLTVSVTLRRNSQKNYHTDSQSYFSFICFCMDIFNDQSLSSLIFSFVVSNPLLSLHNKIKDSIVIVSLLKSHLTIWFFVVKIPALWWICPFFSLRCFLLFLAQEFNHNYFKGCVWQLWYVYDLWVY